MNLRLMSKIKGMGSSSLQRSQSILDFTAARARANKATPANVRRCIDGKLYTPEVNGYLKMESHTHACIYIRIIGYAILYYIQCISVNVPSKEATKIVRKAFTLLNGRSISVPKF